MTSEFEKMLSIHVPVETTIDRASATFRAFEKAADALVKPLKPLVRNMTDEDIPELLKIEGSSFGETEAYSEEIFRDWPIGDALVAEVDGKPVAYLLHKADKDMPSHQYGVSLAVAPGFRRRGLGKLLMKTMMGEHSRIAVDVDTKNKASRGMLKKLGFKTTRTYKEPTRRTHRMVLVQKEKEASEISEDEPKKHYLGRYKCPHCGGTNLYNGIPGTGTTFRGSGVCDDCKEGCSIIGLRLKRLGDGPEIVPTDEQIDRKKRWDDLEDKLKQDSKNAYDEYVPHMMLVKRAADEDNHTFTIAVDLDGTLAEKEEPFNPDTIGEPITKAVRWVRRFQKAGARIIIFTVRGDKELVSDWLDEHEVPYDYVNENPDQPPNTSGKVFADVYWDDKAYNAQDADEHGPEILRLLKEHEGTEEEKTEADGTTITIARHTIVTITGPMLLNALGGKEDE